MALFRLAAGSIPGYYTASCCSWWLFSVVFRKYSANQKIGSFHYIHKTPFGNYSFVCADATLTPGPKRPYNFFGILSQVSPLLYRHIFFMTSQSLHIVVYSLLLLLI